MDEKKSNYSSNVADHEINIGECSSEGEDEGEGDDEEELEEDIESVGNEDSEEAIDEEDETIDSVSLSSENFNGFKNLDYPLDESSSQDVSENLRKRSNDLETSLQSKTIVTSVISITAGETKFSVKLKRFKGPDNVCCLCNLGEQSQLGQGKLYTIKKPESFVEEQLSETDRIRSVDFPKAKEVSIGKNKKTASRHNLSPHEPVDEHSMIGFTERINLSALFDKEDYICIHSNCALFSRQITYNGNSELENVIPCVTKSLTRICSHCNRYGASVACSFNNCDKIFHYPCSAASAGFQHLKTYLFICATHIDHVPLLPTFNEVSCHMCFSLGDVSNLVMCSICGNHYHGICLGRALLPGVRTGWQCSECRSCQICHASEESSKIMLCEVCDKAYHSACLRPAVTSIPKFGWKCQYCRICSDCGSRTPGSGLSSRWHRHFTVCDSCYQQRNKGFFCPLCFRAYRTGSSKEMSQCTSCEKFVHRTCDPEADPVAYKKKIEIIPNYKYICPACKNKHQFGKITLKRKESFDDSCVDMNVNTSHESVTSEDMEIDSTGEKVISKDDYKSVEASGGLGLGKGKPFTARKKMAFSSARGFKSKYRGKTAFCPPLYQKKNQKIFDFCKKKYTKTKMRGVFGAPSAGLQGPAPDSHTKSDRECDEKKVLLCSTSDEFVLSQDICVKCSALGTDQEGCLIACVQCGQCYHPYCADSNKVTKITKVILQRGWKCIKCAVCEGCGKCDNESVLILCDDCNIAYHTYCVEPKLNSVPEGPWKCKWCAHCLTCGANEPGVNSAWLKNYTECGPCASRVRCPSCFLLYSEGDLIIKCENCERWLHGVCDQIRNESDAEKCAIEGYSCLLCRPKDIQPPHLLLPPKTTLASNASKLKITPVSPTKISESSSKDETEHFVDGTYLSENGLSHLTSLLNRIDTNVFSLRKKKRTNNSEQGEQGILDSIESVIAGEESPSCSKIIIYKEGMVIQPREDGKPPKAPEGFNIYTNESGIMVLKKKRIRKIGVGGFNARMRTGKKDKAEDDEMGFYNEDTFSSRSVMSFSDEKPRKKNRYRKPKSKYAESYPSYIQDAFFGRELLDTSKDTVQNMESSDSDSAEVLSSRKITSAETVVLSQDELKVMEEVNAKREKMEEEAKKREQEALKLAAMKIKIEKEKQEEKVDELIDNDNETFKDILNMSGNFLDTIMNENNSRPKINSTMVNDINLRSETNAGSYSSNNPKDELTDILGPNFNLESMVHESGLPNMDGKDVEDIFKEVLTDDSQNSHDSVLPHANVNKVSSSTFPMNQAAVNPRPTIVNSMQSGIPQTTTTLMSPSHSVIQGGMHIPPNRAAPLTPSQVLPSPQNIPSPATYPATSPYHSEYSNSPSQFSPAFSEPPSPWVQDDTPPNESANVMTPSTNANKRTSQKMEVDESLGDKATISSVLYANSEHPELKIEYPVWSDRCKQILKKWRALSADKKQPYLNQARENRTNMTRVRKSSKEQEKIISMQKVKESEQEKSWKQIQALRQQQMQDPRFQTLQRIQSQPSSPQQQNPFRLMAGGGVDNANVMFAGSPVADNRTQIQIVSSQDAMSSPLISPGRLPQRFSSPVIKLPPPSQVNQTYQRVQGQDMFTPPTTPRPQFYSASPNIPVQANNSIRQRSAENEVYSAVNSNEEMNRQLRELLQKQQMESVQTDSQSTPTRIWAQDSSNQQVISDNSNIQDDQMNMPTSSNIQTQMFDNPQNVGNMSQPFRPPLPPRPQRLPLQVAQQILLKQRTPQQTMDPRFRFHIQHQQHQLLQQQQQQRQQQKQQQQFQQQQHQMQILPPQHNMRITIPNQVAPPPPSSSQHKPDSLREAQLSEQAQNILTGNVRLDEGSGPGDEVTSTNKPTELNTTNSSNDTQNEGLPESVTADLDELEKDEVDTGNMSEIFNDLMEDELLLADLGRGFNILEYADPELDNLTNREKSNILYDFVNSASDSTKARGDEKSDRKNDTKEVAPAYDDIKFPPNETKDLQIQIQQVQNNLKENNILTVGKAQQQCVMQVQRTSVQNPSSPSSSGDQQLMHHPSPNNSQVSLQTHSSSTPPSAAIPGIRSPLQAPSTPRSQDLMTQSSITGDVLKQLPAIAPPAPPTPPPPPPPYPGPPPPYPSQLKLQFSQQEHHTSRSPAPNIIAASGGTSGTKLVQHGQVPTITSQVQKRPLLLQEQPLLLEDLLEQEKREQEKQTGNNTCGALPALSDDDFELLRADILNSTGVNGSMQSLLSPQSQNLRPALLPSCATSVQSNVKIKTGGNGYEVSQPQMWPQLPVTNNIQSNSVSSVQASSSSRAEIAQRLPLFNAPKLQVPPEPPENIITEQDQRMQQAYESWLDQQNSIVTQQLKHYEGEIAKMRKNKKSLNTKQRVLKKQHNELNERDAADLQKVTSELSVLQKYLDSSRKLFKQHATLIQEYKNKHSNSLYASSSIESPSSSQSTPVPVNVVSSTSTAIGENPSKVVVTSTQHEASVVVASTFNRTNPPNVVTQTQPNEMQYVVGSSRQETSSANISSPSIVTSQIRPAFRGQEQIIRYPGGAPIRFVRQQKPNLMTYQVPNDGVRQTGMYQNVRGTFKTQPFIVSAVSAPPSPAVSTVTSTMAPLFQNTTTQQHALDQQQILIQRQQFARRPIMLQQNADLNALTTRHRRIFQQRQNLISQIQSIQTQINNADLSVQNKQTLSLQKEALIKQVKELQQQIEMTPQLKQQFLAQRHQILQQQQQQHKQTAGMNQQVNQILVASQQASIQQKHLSPQNSVNQQLNHLLNHSPETNQHQFSQSMNSPIQPQSPQQFSHPHSNSSAPPHSPMYQSQPMLSPTGNTNYSYLHSGPPSVQSHYNQPASPMPPQSPRHITQFVHPSSSPAHPQSPFTLHDVDNAGGGGGNPMSYTNAIPIPEEFRRLGIKPGLFGGSPTSMNTKKTKILAHEFEKYGIKGGLLGGTPMWNEKPEGNGVGKVEDDEKSASVQDVDTKACTSKSPTSATSSQFYAIEEDIDSPVFFSSSDKELKINSPGLESPKNFENAEFQGCETSKTLDDSIELPVYKDVPLIESCKSEEINASDDSMELPMYKDVRLIEGCKSEESSLCFPTSIEDNEISLPLDIDTSELHLTLDSGDVRSDDLLEGCLVSSDLLVLNVNEEQEIVEETKYTPETVNSKPSRTTSVVRTTTTLTTTLMNDLADENPISCEEASTVNHSVISTNAFHSYAKIVENENNEDSVETKEEPEFECKNKLKPEPDRELELEPVLESEHNLETESSEKAESKNTEITEKLAGEQKESEIEEHANLPEIINAAVTPVVTTVPTRTTSVLQMIPASLQTSASKEITASDTQLSSPFYAENFHSYVKKLPNSYENDIAKDDPIENNDTSEKYEQLFDETVIKIKTESMTVEEQEEEQTADEKKETSQNTSTDTNESPLIVTKYFASSSVITKDAKLVSVPHSTTQNQPKEYSSAVQLQPQQVTGIMCPPRTRPSDESQNVLLKQLLQNAGSCSITHSTMTQHVAKPPPSPSYKSPPTNTTTETSASISTTETVIAPVGELSFKTEPRVHYAPVSISVPTTVIKQEIGVPSTSSRKESTTVVLSTQTAAPTFTNTVGAMHVDIKKEIASDELMSPQSKPPDVPDTPNSINGDSSTGSILDAQDLKKLKRRQYQAKRRQSQSKDNAAVPKKRNKRVSKVDEDYDTFVDGLMNRIRQLPRIEITEPLLIHNYAACLPYGAGDGTKINLKSWVNGELSGKFGSSRVPKHNDYYNAEPFGDEEPIPQLAVSPPTNDFYNVELPPLNLEADYEERRLEIARLDRELDTPDSVISSSSPECIIPHTPSRFAGLKLIDENGSGVDSEEDEKLLKRISPVIPLVVPLALRPRVQYQNDFFAQNKENYGKSIPFSLKSRNQPGIPLKDKANLSVTLTLSSQAAQDIVGVLKNLATVLNIPPPVSYKISDRIQTPNKVNAFGNKFNDDIDEVELGKYLDGCVKHCQHCKTPINDYTSVKKKASDVPFIVQDGVSEDLLFCSTSCYLQMILLVPPVISEHKVSSSDDHVSESLPRKKIRLERSNDADVSEVSQVFKVTDAASGKDISYVEKTSLTPESTTKNEQIGDKKQLKGIRYRTWSSDSIPTPVQKFKTPTEKEITETLFRMNITVIPSRMPDDMRSCIFCQQSGDGVANGPSRLLNYDVDKWAHLNCSLWSDGVYETQNGALMNVDTALKQGVDVTCTYCRRNGATLKCFKLRCSKVYHLSCAMKSGCCFLENKSVFCEEHLSKAEINRVLTTLAVYRRVYIDRDENRQIASVIKHAELTHLMRIGSLVFLNVGSLLPHQLQEFHTPNFIYPVGYKVIRFYWSMRIFNKRCQYVCSIHDVAGRPEFRVLVQEHGQDDLELRGSSPNAVWTRILEPLANLRKINNSVQLFPCYVTGEYLFGLTEPAIVRILENLPGIETLGDYTFKFGRDPQLELPLAVNPSGCARCEPRVRGPPLKRTHTQRTSSVMPRPVLTSSPLFSGDLSCPYSKHFVHSKSSQYKKMKQEWRNHVYLARSKIQGLGLYAARDIDKHTMVIEYIGEIIRSQLSDFREKQYEAKNRGVYMFRLDENRVVDATISGGLARYINHSCNPNCVTEKVEVDREYRIIIFSKRRIVRGEELSYDYQFDIEDDMHKIPCLCGAPNCRKWMN